MQCSLEFGEVVEDLLNASAEIKDASIQSLLGAVPAYKRLDPQELDATARANIADAMEALRTGVVLPGIYQERAHSIAAKRIQYGIAVEDIFRGYRVAAAEITSRFIETALEKRLSATAIVRGNELLWQLADAFTSAISTAYQEYLSERDARDYSARHDFLVKIYEETLPADEMASSLRRFGMFPDESVLGFLAEYRGGRSSRTYEIFEQKGAAFNRYISAHSSTTVIWGLTQQKLHPRPAWMVVFGHPVPVQEAASSLRLATQLWRRVPADWVGTATAETLSWKGLAVSDALYSTLEAKYFSPLSSESPDFRATLWESVKTYIEHDRNVSSAAAALFVHHNTLRYRLRRFEALAEVSLKSVDTLIEIGILAHEIYLRSE
jgi:putative transposase